MGLFDMGPMAPCPRCGRGTDQPLCGGCDHDMRAESEMGVHIPEELWPIEAAADFARAAERSGA